MYITTKVVKVNLEINKFSYFIVINYFNGNSVVSYICFIQNDL